MSPAQAVPLFIDLYRSGRLKLDELVTRTFSLDEIKDGWAAMYDGSTVRALVLHDS
jgi:S-(hydroxymethyl)glutathione dehydrogenase/alcohol dehydrogenase